MDYYGNEVSVDGIVNVGKIIILINNIATANDDEWDSTRLFKCFIISNNTSCLQMSLCLCFGVGVHFLWANLLKSYLFKLITCFSETPSFLIFAKRGLSVLSPDPLIKRKNTKKKKTLRKFVVTWNNNCETGKGVATWTLLTVAIVYELDVECWRALLFWWWFSVYAKASRHRLARASWVCRQFRLIWKHWSECCQYCPVSLAEKKAVVMSLQRT